MNEFDPQNEDGDTYNSYDDDPQFDNFDTPDAESAVESGAELPTLLDDFHYAAEPRPERKSRARERIEKRRRGGQGNETPAVTPLASTPPRATNRNRTTQARMPQVVAEGRREFKLSDLPLPMIKLGIYLIGAMVLVAGVIIGLGIFKEDPIDTEPNALWVGTEWTYETHTDEEVQAFAKKLKDHHIGTLYAWVSWYTGDKKWAGSADGAKDFSEREASVKQFVSQIKVAYPDVTLYGWLGFPVTGSGIEYRLNDADIQAEIAKFSLKTVTELGFEGVFLNVEPVWNNNADDFIQLINRVRLDVGDEALIAVVIPPDWTPLGVNIPQPATIVPGTEWDKQFKQRVALLTDEMAIMAYGSGLNSAFDYIPWVAYQVEVYAKAVSEIDGGADLMIGIPTYDTELPAHRTDVENVSSALSGVRQGLAQAGDAAKVVRGIAIYTEWTTDDNEWLQFKQGWTP
ncbi:MAG TPA: hypothetical protein VHL11_02310 [Phototrophicaceae bacterium]|jgi:hypothetical protein|nr:hypothetical protein [Phototrophicaceae bacterium]